jgi:type IV pilus assembly protein PilQ
VPVLGDLPLIGVFFRRRTEQDTPRYLLVFVTATIVKDSGEFLVYDEASQAAPFTPSTGAAEHDSPLFPVPGLTSPATTNAVPQPGATNAVPTPAAHPATNAVPQVSASTAPATNAVPVPPPAAAAPTNTPANPAAAPTNAVPAPK